MTTNLSATDASEQPDRFAEVADSLRILADRFTLLVGSGLPLSFVQLSLQPGRHGVDDSVVGAVDAVTACLLGHPGQVQEMSSGGYHYSNGDGSELVGAVGVRIFNSVSTEVAVKRKAAAELAAKEAELARLRAEIEKLRADAQECQEAGCTPHFIGDPCPSADGPVLVVPHGPVRPPYGSPERDAWGRRACVDPGDQEHDHETCQDVVAEEQGETASEAR